MLTGASVGSYLPSGTFSSEDGDIFSNHGDIFLDFLVTVLDIYILIGDSYYIVPPKQVGFVPPFGGKDTKSRE